MTFLERLQLAQRSPRFRALVTVLLLSSQAEVGFAQQAPESTAPRAAEAHAPAGAAGEDSAKAAEAASVSSPTPDQDALVESLSRAMLARMTIWRTSNGDSVHVAHCRGAADGCDARVRLFARWMVEIAEEFEIDPFVLAAVAFRESGLDPFAQGTAGEMGIVQLHPRGVGSRVQFVSSERYRGQCHDRTGACQREVLQAGAQHLAEAVTRCGDLNAGLGAYNTGTCGETAYSRRVLRERRVLVQYAKRGDSRFARGSSDGRQAAQGQRESPRTPAPPSASR